MGNFAERQCGISVSAVTAAVLYIKAALGVARVTPRALDLLNDTGVTTGRQNKNLCSNAAVLGAALLPRGDALAGRRCAAWEVCIQICHSVGSLPHMPAVPLPLQSAPLAKPVSGTWLWRHNDARASEPSLREVHEQFHRLCDPVRFGGEQR
jgi:hypothetical protein